ncbi:hypothetical protein LPJ78_002195 [Coemansia sp. RSA 989]|nr:hepatocellular carcinoma-associated antigen 59-domain-containing protein [Coemansia mojavensis]KAJ1750123.1 hypothetical protein LPJ79_003146 [Coemansia sp. RSA 1821]KAJ1865994.1 hypothetical protein LPJ78_002195 [Coemansia sp. RSA 989]KAJ1873352.1 hypothetical protein LPJ55_002395 [Coemansia sp. RSA 990]KAJ2669776.1 hypothetical protein IWW42_004363 [Coemansia sp. RSA 1085]
MPVKSMPPKRPRNLRKPRNVADWEAPADKQEHSAAGSAQATASTDETAIDPADLLEYQRIRAKKNRGIDVDALAKYSHKKRTSSKHTDKRSAVEDDDGEKKRSKLSQSLEGAFTQQTNKLDANKHMMAYIESEMRRRRACSAEDGHVSEDDAADTDDPYHMPDHLQVVGQQPVAEGSVAMASKMLTSIQEVELGAEPKIRNALATDQALAQPARLQSSSSEEPLNTRFKHHGSKAGGRHTRATDDAVLQRFKKRMRR